MKIDIAYVDHEEKSGRRSGPMAQRLTAAGNAQQEGPPSQGRGTRYPQGAPPQTSTKPRAPAGATTHDGATGTQVFHSDRPHITATVRTLDDGSKAVHLHSPANAQTNERRRESPKRATARWRKQIPSLPKCLADRHFRKKFGPTPRTLTCDLAKRKRT